jgi:outer membrane cobalamin receptor
LLSLCASAADLKIVVQDASGRPVSAARVALLDADKTVSVQTTTAQGTAVFHGTEARSYRAQVFAPGFASRTEELRAGEEETIVELHVASIPETVNVTAARLPLPTEQSAADVSELSGNELRALQPVSAAEAIRFLPGVVVNAAGRRGGQASLFVRGGESRYNKVIVDDVTINDPGGTFDFGVVPLSEVDRVEFVRGAESTLYGSDAMTSVVQFWSRNGTSRTPDLRFGAEGGTFETARGYASVAGAWRAIDYNVFGEQFNTSGQGVNDAYGNASQGGNIGVTFSPRNVLRIRARHSNNRTGVPGITTFGGEQRLPPDSDTRARQNNFLASAVWTLSAPNKWQHRFTGFEYNHKRSVVDEFQDPGRGNAFGSFDFPFSDFASINRAGFEYQGEYWASDWAKSAFGYRFEDENGFVGDLTLPPLTHALRRNHEIYGQQVITWRRLAVVAGGRFVHSESFGNKGVPRVALSYLLRRGGNVFSGTRLRGSYATGIKEPRFEESFGIGAFNIIPNPNLKPEENRAFEAGFEQQLFGNKAAFTATYFNNLFRNRIDFTVLDFTTFQSQYINVNKALAHGVELALSVRASRNMEVQGGYVYTSTEILEAPLASDPLLDVGSPLLRRPKHSGNLLVTYSRTRWGGMLGGSFIGRRADSDFFGLLPPVTYVAGYARVDLGAWFAVSRWATAYINVENALNRKYEESAGYPGLRANFRAGMRFRFGGE